MNGKYFVVSWNGFKKIIFNIDALWYCINERRDNPFKIINIYISLCNAFSLK